MSLVVVGSFGIDSVETPHGKAEDAIGGSAIYFSLAASLLTDVRLAGNIGYDFPSDVLSLLENRGADLSGVRSFADKPNFRWKGRYVGDMAEAETLATELNVLVEPTVIPSSYKGEPIAFLANMSPAVQLAMLDALESQVVFADTMNLWIDTELETLHEVLGRIDGLILNDAEARSLTGEGQLLNAGSALLEVGPRVVVVKKGENGAILFSNDCEFHVPAFPTRSVVDPTGAGDSFAGGFLGSLALSGKLSAESFPLAMAMGTAAASFTVEDFSTNGLQLATRESLEERVAALREYVTF